MSKCWNSTHHPMQANKENIESIHRIDPESTGEIAGRFEELVHLLENESD